ncbi:MAG: LAGLIDADG family homing endonuclease [Patescibacteria group bacterium]
MAYVLGFFTADGSMIKNKRGAHFIEFQITDKDLLFKIRKALGSNHKITTRKRGRNWKTIYRLQIGSKKIYNDLIVLGLTERKSRTINFPYVPNKYLSHFIRGYFDGDGNVTVSKYRRSDRGGRFFKTILSGFVCGSSNFLKVLHQKLKRVAKLSGGTFYYHDNGYRLAFSVKDSLVLCNFMYNDMKNDLFLSRKKTKFEKYFKIR